MTKMNPFPKAGDHANATAGSISRNLKALLPRNNRILIASEMDQNLLPSALPDTWSAACVLQQQELRGTFDRDFIYPLLPKRLQLLQPTV